MADPSIPFDAVESAAQILCDLLRKYCGNRRDLPVKQANVRIARVQRRNAPEVEDQRVEEVKALCEDVSALIAKLKRDSSINGKTTAPTSVRDPMPRASPITSNETSRQAARPVHSSKPTVNSKGPFHLTHDDMGKQFPHSLSRLYQTKNFDGFFTFDPGHIDPKRVIQGLNPSEKSDQLRPEQLAMRYEAGERFPHIRPVKPKNFRLTDDFKSPGLTEPLSDSDSEAFLNDTLSELPKGALDYYTGPVPTPEANNLLDSGDALRALQKTDIPGVNTTHIHYGEEYSGTSTHCEDAGFWSGNTVVYGYKILLRVATKDNKKLEDLVGGSSTSERCAQFVRHLSVLPSPRQLRDAGIEFVTRCLGPGDGFVTEPGQYHLVVNRTISVAFSINFTLPNESPLPDELVVCEDCGLYGLDDPRIKRLPNNPMRPRKEPGQATTVETRYVVTPKKRPAPTASQGDTVTKAVANSQKKRKQAALDMPAPAPEQRTTRALAALQKMENTMSSEMSWVKIPEYRTDSPPSPIALKLAAVVCSSRATKQFVELVRQQRSLNRRGPLNAEVASQLNGKLSYVQLQRRLIQTQIFREDRDMKKQGVEQQRLSSDQASAVTAKYNVDIKTFNRHKQAGEVWNRLIGKHNGLLCFLILQPSSSSFFSKDSIAALTDEDIDHIQSLLDNDFARALLRPAKALEASLYNCGDIILNMDTSGKPLEICKAEEALEQLQLLPFTDQNIWDPELFPEKPTNWPDGQEWPVDPTALAQDDSTRCDFCPGGDDCACENTIDQAYQLKYYGSELGLQAVTQEPGAVAYKEGSILGVRAGEIVPADKFHDRWTVKFRRPDFKGSPVVCAIRTANSGNCLGFVRRSESFNVYFHSVRRNGRWVLVVKACKDIMDGEQITVDERSD